MALDAFHHLGSQTATMPTGFMTLRLFPFPFRQEKTEGT
jgi:hypothetical protein